MSKPQFVLEEALDCYLSRACRSHRAEHDVDSLVDFSIGLLVGLKAAHGEILVTEEPNAVTDKN